ncbi:MAG: heteromeric transposase endonuclease subunit TnsA [Hydrogenovibrio sp.]
MSIKFSHKNRKIGYTYGSLSGIFSFRGDKSIAFESKLEKNLLQILEFNDSVIDVEEQPFTLEYRNQKGRMTTYTPDFLVRFKALPSTISHLPYPKPLIIEVKPRNKIQTEFQKLKPKFKTGLRFANENDMNFRIYDESRIYTQEFENIEFLSRYKKRDYDTENEMRILEHLNNIGHTTVDHLLCTLFVTKEEQGVALGQIWHMLVTKKISCDIGKKLSLCSVIWLNREESNHEGVLQYGS